MAFKRILIPLSLSVFVGVALSSSLNSFYTNPLNPSAPFLAISNIDDAWLLCADGNDTNATEYGELLREARVCIDELSSDSQSLCHSLEVNIQKCSQPLEEFFVDCLPEKSKDLPPAILKGATSMIETFCASTGEILIEAFHPCIYEYLEQRNKTIKEECKKENFYTKLDKYENELPSKSEFCEFARDLGGCWQEYVNQDCKSSKTREFFSKFYNAGFSACKTK